jgi:hypothetical protein
VLHGISNGARAFADKIGIQLLAIKDSLGEDISSIFLCNPGAHTGCQCTGKRPEDGRQCRSARQVPRCADEAHFRGAQKGASSPVEAEEGEANKQCNIQTDADRDTALFIVVVRILLVRFSWICLATDPVGISLSIPEEREHGLPESLGKSSREGEHSHAPSSVPAPTR